MPHPENLPSRKPALRYLSGADVRRAARRIDAVEAVRHALALHAAGLTTLPAEAYLPWTTSDGSQARSLALPAALWGDEPAIGLKVINSSLANPGRGLPRAQGLVMIFDRERAHPVAIMEAAHLSALRTAAYTVLSQRLLGRPDTGRIGVIGCGALAETHVRLLAAEHPDAEFVLHDLEPDRAARHVTLLRDDGIRCSATPSAERAVRDCQLVVTTTTTTTGYLPFGWLARGALLAHVSLDDAMPDVVRRADLVVVDDWSLIAADDRRLLGRMYRSGDLAGPDGQRWPAGPPDPHGAAPRAVDATLADVVAGRHPGRTSPDQIVLSNPFGMGILDVAVAAETLRVAEGLGIGVALPA